jgi:plastocyanin
VRRRAVLAAAAALLAGGAASVAAAQVHDARAPVAVGVAQREFHITTYRRKVKPGAIRFNITNLGQDTHDLVVTGPKRFFAQGPDVQAGERARMSVVLRRPGTYTLLCTRANHAKLGMRAKLVVKR